MKKHLIIFALAVFIFIATTAFVQCRENAETQYLIVAQSQSQMNRDAQDRYKKSDAELNNVYKQLISRVAKEQKNALIDAQLAWIKFRDANSACWASPNKGGSIYPLIYFGRMKKMTEARTAELRELMKELGDR
ncbi:MAG: lysozyme inhibitor LprI family protein [Candidatus Xenobiia bacterium LiM19]